MKKEWHQQDGILPALSVRQPWAYLLIRGIKDIENRDWTTSYRGPLLIHAGKRVDEQCFGSDGRLLAGYWRSRYSDEIAAGMPQHHQEYETGGIVGIMTLVDVVTRSESPWFQGTYGWVIRDAHPLPFIPSRGQLGLFGVPVSILPPDELVERWS